MARAAPTGAISERLLLLPSVVGSRSANEALIYSGFDKVEGACDAPHISKPAAPGELVAAMEKIIRDTIPR